MSSRRAWYSTGLASVLSLSVVGVAGAQPGGKGTESASIEAIRPSAAPAFTLLGVAPAAIERPVTPRALAFSLMSALREGDPLPRNYALEVTPFWFRSQPTVRFEDRYSGRPSLQTFLRTLSFSAATSTPDKDGAPTSASIGVRAQIVSGTASSALTKAVDGLAEAQHARGEMQDPEDDRDQRTTTKGDASAELRSCRDDRVKKAGEGVVNVAEPVGFTLEVAGAGALDFIDPQVEWTRAAAWITAGYQLEEPDLNILGVGRFLRDQREGTSALDVGGRAIFQRGDWGASVEYVQRWNLVGPVLEENYRVAAIVEYRLQGGTYLTATLGKDFKLSRDEIISLVGFSVDFGPTPRVLNEGSQ